MGIRTKGFCKLGLGIVIIWVMMFYVCPAIIEAIPPYKTYADELDRRGIHGGALFYNDVEQAGEGELLIRNALRYPTAGSDKK
ncbi:MAG: hypothetical protein DELT_02005 [Desulfovibrio sp.]